MKAEQGHPAPGQFRHQGQTGPGRLFGILIGGHGPGARHVFLGRLRVKMGELDRGKACATYCVTGFRASIASSLRAAYGFENIRNVPGSWKAWSAAGYPVETPERK